MEHTNVDRTTRINGVKTASLFVRRIVEYFKYKRITTYLHIVYCNIRIYYARRAAVLHTRLCNFRDKTNEYTVFSSVGTRSGRTILIRLEQRTRPGSNRRQHGSAIIQIVGRKCDYDYTGKRVKPAGRTL